jgi:hypothetical protein
MGRPRKNTVTSTSAEDVSAVVARVAKKLKSFDVKTLNASVNKSFSEVTAEDAKVLEASVADFVAANVAKYTVANGTYTAVAGKRGRPRKVVAAAA